jgi:Serine phosphatase RsbU, regulator of sigma subunit
LEELVKQRTLELENSLKQVQELKLKQDADYFLTSQLLKPLNVNEVKDDGLVKVEMKIDYYKKFQFRHWNSEIGGDFCYAHKITLRGKDYIFCANADAMGKSIQGAGGALVFGSVLEAIVERTLYEDSVKQQFPEVWLKNSFIELHKVFESFDGTMLVSCILLLLDERDGCVYHINAEHPNLVLMSGDNVKFIVPRKAYMKLGVSKEGLIEIDVLKLKEGDRLFLGSDGKDDLVLGQEDGVRIINEDETLFLDLVKESNGDLEMIYQNLKERAELMDDLSLISIEYRGDKEYLMQNRYIPKEDKILYDKAVTLMEEGKNEESYAILLDLKNRYEQNGIVRKRLGFVSLRLGKIKQGIEELEIASELIPWDSDVIKILSKSYFKIRDFEKAREYGELYLLRESEDKEMIKYLIDVYQRLKESFRDKYKEIADKKIHKYQKLLSVA